MDPEISSPIQDQTGGRYINNFGKRRSEDPIIFRPISITIKQSKVFERVSQIPNYLEEILLLYNQQSGFRSKLPTTETFIHC